MEFIIIYIIGIIIGYLGAKIFHESWDRKYCIYLIDIIIILIPFINILFGFMAFLLRKRDDKI